MKARTFFAGAALAALLAGTANAAEVKKEAPKTGNTYVTAAEKRDDLFYWTPTVGGATVRSPFTTRYPARGRFVVVGDNQYSAAAGFKILDRGGNAFDAAAAMAAATGLAYPTMNDFFGGDAMIIVYSAKDKKVITYNGCGWAPKKATIEKYVELGGIPNQGILSVEIPGSFSGWMQALRDYGTMKLADIFEPAVTMAEQGYALSQLMAKRGKVTFKHLNDEARKVFARDGKMADYGTRIVNPEVAALMRELGAMSYEEAEDYFYRGPIAREIAEFSKKLGGLIEYEDLAEFRAEKVAADSTNFRGVDVFVCPPNSQGWALLESLNLLEPFDLKQMGHNSAAYLDTIAQALNLALADRNKHMADGRFHKNPRAMIEKPYAQERRKDMTPGAALDGELSTGDPEKFTDVTYGKAGDTTFFAVADAEGNVVACTTSICNVFGSCLMVPGRGFILNNRLTYFFLDEELPNYLEPRKRTVQTITPSIALKDGRPYLAFGTPGADVQEQAKLQVFLNYAVFGMDPQQAVEAPRLCSRHPMGIFSHASYPRTIQVEGRVSQAVRDELKEKYGYVVQTKGDWEYVGYMGAIGFDETNGFRVAGSDPRSDAVAYGF